MKNILLLIVGVGAGFVIAHQVSKTDPAGKQFFEHVDSSCEVSSAPLSSTATARGSRGRC
jgi:hypothetical protein